MFILPPLSFGTIRGRKLAFMGESEIPVSEISLAGRVPVLVSLAIIERALSNMPYEELFTMVTGNGGYSAHRVTRFS